MRRPLFLARAVYRRRRLRDAARLLPVLGFFLLMLPAFGHRAEAEGRTLAPYLSMLNRVRREHRSLQLLRNLTVHGSDDENILVFAKQAVVGDPRPVPDLGRDQLVVVKTLDDEGLDVGGFLVALDEAHP